MGIHHKDERKPGNRKILLSKLPNELLPVSERTLDLKIDDSERKMI